MVVAQIIEIVALGDLLGLIVLDPLSQMIQTNEEFW